MKHHCINCGERVYDGACVNCHEDVFIANQNAGNGKYSVPIPKTLAKIESYRHEIKENRKRVEDRKRELRFKLQKIEEADDDDPHLHGLLDNL